MGDFVFVPQAYNIGKLHVQHPDSSIGDFDVDRNSIATYIGKDGLSKQALPNMPRIDYSHLSYDMTKPRTSTNVYTHSNDLTNNDSWTRVSVTALKDSEDPFNTNNGSVLNETIAENQHSFSRNGNVVIGRKHTVSFYFKMMGRRYVLVAPNNGGVLSVNAWFDLQDGVVVSNSQGIAAITDEGNGWYRCSISNIAEDTGVIRLNIFLADQPLNNARIYEGDISKGLRVYGAQLEEGDLSPVISTENTPVTRYRPLVSGNGRLLTELSSTNSFSNSEQIGGNLQTGVGAKNVSYTNNFPSSFGGYNGSINILGGTFTNDSVRAVLQTPAVTGEHVWVSFKVKKTPGLYMSLLNGNAVNATNLKINLEDGGILFTSGEAVENSFVKVRDSYLEIAIRMSFFSTTAAGLLNIGIYDNDQFQSFDSTGLSVEITAIQGEYNVTEPSTYIPTNGSSVTRADDLIINGGDDIVFNDSEGTIFFEGSALTNEGVISSITLSDGSNHNRIALIFHPTASRVIAVINTESVDDRNTDKTLNHKYVIRYNTNGILTFFVDGVNIGSTSTPVSLLGLNELKIANAGNVPFQGRTSQLRYFDRALTDEECSKL